MAGSFQHHIPQMLQRGFRIRGGSKKRSMVWVYQRGLDARTELVKDIGAEEHFYSEPPTDGLKSLDDQITEYETSFDKLLGGLKQANSGCAVDAHQAAEVVAHLTIRNAYLRRTISLGVEKLCSDASVLFGNETTLRPMMGVDDKSPSVRFKEAIDDFIEANPEFKQLGLPKKVLHQIGHMLMKEQFNRFFSEQIPQLIAAIGGAATLAPAWVRDSHNKILTNGMAPDRRVQELEALQWSILSPSQGSLILPDCVAVALDDQPGFKSLLLANLGMTKVVFLPLSSTKLLVGLRRGEKFPDLATFNEAAAACSQDFFIANEESAELKRLQSLIATTTTKFIDEAIGSAISEFSKNRLSSLAEPVSNDIGTTEEVDRNANEYVLPNYSVRFVGCADEATAQRIAAVLKSVTNELGKAVPLSRLDGFTFAHDYEAALRDLDRGFETSIPLASTAPDYGVGVSMAPMVIRDGIAKTHIVMRGDMGHGLLSEDESQWRFAYHLIVGQLANVANLEMLDRAFPKVLGNQLEDRYAAFLYAQVDAAWDAYHSMRISAAFDPSASDGYCELLLSALKAAQTDILAARYDYRFHGDVDRFLATVLPRIRNILWFSGKVLGHYDGLARPLFSNVELARALELAKLTDWFVLFDGELSDLWSRKGQWTSFDEFLHLNRHVERLLWAFGIFPWKNDEGDVRVEVPLLSDAHRLSGIGPMLRAFLSPIIGRIRRFLPPMRLTHGP